MKLKRHFLKIFTFIVIVANLVVMHYFEDSIERWTGFATMGLFFLIFLSQSYFLKRGLLIFSLLLISDALLINYEDPIFNGLIFLVRGSVFLLLMALIINRLRVLKTNLFQKIAFTIAVLLNIYLLYTFADVMFKGEYLSLFDLLFYFYGMAIIACVIAAVCYSNRYSNKPSLIFFGAILSLVFSDLTYFIGFYLDFTVFFIAEKIFNFLGIALLLHFMKIFGKQEKMNSNKILGS